MQQFIESMAPMQKIYDGMMDEVEKSKTDDGIKWDLINVPTLAIASTIDKDVSMDHVERVAEKVSHGRIVLVKNAGHFIWWGEEKEKVVSATLQFIEENKS